MLLQAQRETLAMPKRKYAIAARLLFGLMYLLY